MAITPGAASSTQDSTQSTQQEASQPSIVIDTNIWGSLIPFNPHNKRVERIDFRKDKQLYTIGRSRKNDFHFPFFPKISQMHCTIEWDGEESSLSAVIVKDLMSSNGTYINGKRIRKGEGKVLQDWNLISFGPPPEDPEGRPKEDYRFFFRHMASRQRASDEGLYETYDVLHVLGRGAYATVVKAFHKKECKMYAVKMFSADKLRQILENTASRGHDRSSTTSHLQKEVQILEKMKHPNICKLKEAFYEGYSVSVVIELVPGGDLMSYLLNRDVLLEPEAQDITYQVCDALAYMHGMGVVHRDLKPENVLLTEDRPPFIKVADFGLAKVLDSLSMLQTKCGTPTFVAPEVLLHGPDGYDKVVDSWSLGVMVFMMLTKANPFHQEYMDDADWRLLREYNILGDGDDFIRSLLEFQPQRRMTPEQALAHPWICREKDKIHTRRLERENSLRSVASSNSTISALSERRLRRLDDSSAPGSATSTAAPTPTATRANTPALATRGGAKRKASGDVRELGHSLSFMFVNDDYGTPRPTKRARVVPPPPPGGKVGVDPETIIPASLSLASPKIPPLGWPAPEEMDEVPGLGTWSATLSSSGGL